ncbi:hypothetical protein DMUE_4018 [Dictyocoela muelleri]|nr:hypothetical protein DMUE_4018 [Dictyocoela muelleri]
MNIKPRKTITSELRDLVIYLFITDGHNVSQISNISKLHRHTVRKILQDHEDNANFLSAAEKRKQTCKARNSILSSTEQTIYNSLSLNNSMVQAEIKNIVSDAHDLTLSISTVCRKINKVGLTRKRLTSVSNERNSNERINERKIFATDLSRISNEN